MSTRFTKYLLLKIKDEETILLKFRINIRV